MLSVLSCNKELEVLPADEKEHLRSDIAAKLNQDVYPVNLLSNEAKKEIINGIVINNNRIVCFRDLKFTNDVLKLEDKIALYELLTERGVHYYFEGDLIHVGKLAKTYEFSNSNHDPIDAWHGNRTWNYQQNKCCKQRYSDCLGVPCND